MQLYKENEIFLCYNNSKSSKRDWQCTVKNKTATKTAAAEEQFASTEKKKKTVSPQVCFYVKQSVCFFCLHTSPDGLCNVSGNTCPSLCVLEHPDIFATSHPLLSSFTCFHFFLQWHRPHDGALKEKVGPIWVRGKTRREEKHTAQDSACTGSDRFSSPLAFPPLWVPLAFLLSLALYHILFPFFFCFYFS